MSNTYPPMVDSVKSTNGGLHRMPPLVDIQGMTNRPDYSTIGLRLKAIREGFSELSQRAWAEKHSFSPTQYNNWEIGTRRISVDAAEHLAETYGLTLDYIFRGRLDGLSEKARNVL